MPLVNLSRDAKKSRLQPLKFAASQDSNQTTPISDLKSLSLSQPMVSENKLPYYTKQIVRGWKPPLKTVQTCENKNIPDEDSITCLNPSETTLDPTGQTGEDKSQEKCSLVNSANCEVRNSITCDAQVSDTTQTVHEVQESLDSTLPVSKDGTSVAIISNRQQCSDSVIKRSPSACIDEQIEMKNSTSEVQVSNDSKEYHLSKTGAASVNVDNDLNMTENITKLEENFVVHNVNRKTYLEADKVFYLSQQSTQPYVCRENITEAENLWLAEEEEEEEAQLTPPASKSPSHSTNDVHNLEINSDAAQEDTNTNSVVCSSESVHNEKGHTGRQGELPTGEKIQVAVSSKCKELFKEGPSSGRTFSPSISESEMALIPQQGLTETVCTFNSREGCTDDLQKSCTDSLQEPEKSFSHDKSSSPSPCKQINTLSEGTIDANTYIYGECNTFTFSDKRFTSSLEAKLKNVFNFKNYVKGVHSKEEADKNEESTNQVIQLKKPENYQVCMATVKLRGDLKACQMSEERGFVDETKEYMNSNSQDDSTTSTAAYDGFPVLKLNKQLCNKEIILHSDPSTTVLPVEAETAQSSQVILLYNNEIQDLKNANDNKSLDEMENTILNTSDKGLVLERDNDAVMPNDTVSVIERIDTENNSVFQCQKSLDVINTSSYQNIAIHASMVHIEDMDVIPEERINSHDRNELVKERKITETHDKKPVIEHESSEEKEFKCQRNTKSESENINYLNIVTVQSAIINTETAVDKVVNLKPIKVNLVAQCDIPDMKNYLNGLKIDPSSNEIPQDFIYPACSNRNTKKINPTRIDLTDHNVKYPVDEMKDNDHSSNETLKDRSEDAIYPISFERNAERETPTNTTLLDHLRKPLVEMKTSEISEKILHPACFSNAAKKERPTSIDLRDQNIKKPTEEMRTNEQTFNETPWNTLEDSNHPVCFNNGAKNEKSKSTDLKVCNVKNCFAGMKACDHSSNEMLQERPEDTVHPGCFNKRANNEKPSRAPLKDCCSEMLNHSKVKQLLQHPLKNEEAQMGAEDLVLMKNKLQSHKERENKHSGSRFLDTAARSNHTDFSEMEDDFGLTASQILRIEDECQQKMLMPVQWAQKVKESRRKVQAAIQEITMLNAMLKKVRKEVWLPKINTNAGEGTSHSWNTNFLSKSGKNMQRK